jgi:uncharacterized protein (DUF1499 family)
MRIEEREISRRARWSLKLAVFMAQLLLLAVLLHRFEFIDTPTTTNLIVVALIGTAIAIMLAILAFVRIWNTGMGGTGIALSGLLVSLMILALPLYNLPSLIALPAINDVSTDLLSPPQYIRLAKLRESNANSTATPSELAIEKQAQSYPDIDTLLLERSTTNSYELVRSVIDDLGWEVVTDQHPSKTNNQAVIEAVDRSMLLGFKDDIVIRVRPDRGISRIDMRSSSRYGRHDLGSNAKRIKEVFGLIKTRLARAEAQRLDTLERARIARQAREERKRRELERRRRQKAKANEDTVMLPKANFGIDGRPGQTDEFGTSGFGAAPGVPGRITRSKKKVEKTQKIRRSKRRRKNKSWVPFNMDVN